MCTTILAFQQYVRARVGPSPHLLQSQVLGRWELVKSWMEEVSVQVSWDQLLHHGEILDKRCWSATDLALICTSGVTT